MTPDPSHAQAVTPLAHGASSLAQTVTPLAHGASSLARAVTSLAHGASSLARAVTSLAHGASSLARAVTPRAYTASPLAQAVTSLARADPSLVQAGTLRAHAASSLVQAVSPLAHGASSLAQTVSPLAHGASSLAQAGTSRAHAASSLAHGASSQAQTVTSLARAASSLAQAGTSRAHAASSQAQAANPRAHAANPRAQAPPPQAQAQAQPQPQAHAAPPHGGTAPRAVPQHGSAPYPARTTYWCENAWLNGTVEPGVALDVGADGSFAAVRTGVESPPRGSVPLRGLTLPGLANVHSHAFHRALRGTVQVGSGTFWTWRETMYQVASQLTPESYYALARAVYAEMALAGITCVGEFHYLHHGPGGDRYGDPNAMSQALVAAAAEAGIRLTLLDTAYLASGIGPRGRGQPVNRQQLRFSDGTAEAWAERATAFTPEGTHVRMGAAIHSVRAVPARELETVAAWAREREAPLHVHLSEQTAENEACERAHGVTPTALLAEHGVLGPGTTAVHATHLSDADIRLLGSGGTGVCVCPTTERDLADGIGPAPALQAAGVTLSLGSDSHAVIDLFEEARALELNERLRSRTRGHWTAGQLLRAATEDGCAALGWGESGRLERGALADFVTVALDSVRTAGPVARLAGESAVFAATSADVRHTVVGGRHIVRDGEHTAVPAVPTALSQAIATLHP